MCCTKMKSEVRSREGDLDMAGRNGMMGNSWDLIVVYPFGSPSITL